MFLVLSKWDVETCFEPDFFGLPMTTNVRGWELIARRLYPLEYVARFSNNGQLKKTMNAASNEKSWTTNATRLVLLASDIECPN